MDAPSPRLKAETVEKGVLSNVLPNLQPAQLL